MKLQEIASTPVDYNDESKWPKPVKRFEKWYVRNDLWHPAFADRFAECLSDVLDVGDADVYELGEHISNHMHSFYGSAMMELIDYIKQHPLPEDSEQLEKYVEDFKAS